MDRAMNRHITTAAIGLLGLLASCNAMEPYDRIGVWRPTGANQANLAAMVVHPADLARGRGTAGADGHLAAAAVDRLRHDGVKPLSGSSSAAPSALGSAAPTPN
jgi:type IV pilus biogenesis protein CpaD/CtpE